MYMCYVTLCLCDVPPTWQLAQMLADAQVIMYMRDMTHVT